jgi:Putative Actinobacterial Holin-X, holin superfamily III
MQGEQNAADPGLVTQVTAVLAVLGRLVQGELRLARAEVAQGLRGMVGGIVKLVLAGIVALVALNILAGAAVAGLAATGMGPAWAALVVGLVLALVALGLAMAGRAALRLDALRPDRALRGLRRDTEAVKTGLTSEGADHG